MPADWTTYYPTLTRATGQSVGFRFAMPEGLELASVGRLLVVAGDHEALRPLRATQATLIVDDLDGYREVLGAAGAEILRGPDRVPTGRTLTARVAGGLHLEYVEWDSAQWDRIRSSPAPPASPVA